MKYIKFVLTSLISIALTAVVITVLFFKTDPIAIGEQINFQTQSGAFQFTAIPSKGRDYKMMERQFEEFRASHPAMEDTVLYRTTAKNYLKVAKWNQYKMMPEWQYPFLF